MPKTPPAPPARAANCVQAWAAALETAAAGDPNLLVLVNDSLGSAGLEGFAERFPGRVIDVGIAEQNLVSVASGLSAAGKTVFVSSAASFLTGRALEQVKIDVAYAKANVKLVGQSPGVGYGSLGPTHHALEDLSWMSALPGLPVLAPATAEETASAVRWAAARPGCVYLRVPRRLYGTPLEDPAVFTFGRAALLRAGDDVTLVATGAATGLAVAASDRLALVGIAARVLCMSTVKPLDADRLLDAARRTAGLVTVEDALVTGLGAAVAAFLAEQHPAPVRRIGFRDRFAGFGSDAALMDRAGVTAERIAAAARSLCMRRTASVPIRPQPSQGGL